ncbi:hypothetical protein Y032_0195g1501 [Ancylostoma ceylanicum]|uniref:Uncharacterized protein n=1 Tax=Ancylostoma ceylanicum TaxID=53326 RepID=A0A016SNT4_9BILA|nr:hypothetical protein Y032_0195g1501 [Ancylostoma ceylanicum]
MGPPWRSSMGNDGIRVSDGEWVRLSQVVLESFRIRVRLDKAVIKTTGYGTPMEDGSAVAHSVGNVRVPVRLDQVIVETTGNVSADEGVRKAPEHESPDGGWAQHALTVRKGLQRSWSNSEKRGCLVGKGSCGESIIGAGVELLSHECLKKY